MYKRKQWFIIRNNYTAGFVKATQDITSLYHGTLKLCNCDAMLQILPCNTFDAYAISLIIPSEGHVRGY